MDELHDTMKQIADKHTKAKNLIAKSGIQINNTIDEAWKALVNPEIVESPGDPRPQRARRARAQADRPPRPRYSSARAPGRASTMRRRCRRARERAAPWVPCPRRGARREAPCGRRPAASAPRNPAPDTGRGPPRAPPRREGSSRLRSIHREQLDLEDEGRAARDVGLPPLIAVGNRGRADRPGRPS